MTGTSDAEHAVGLIDGSDEALEQMIADVLHRAGEWTSPRTSDGLRGFRVVAREPARLRVCGRIWSIDQELHSFWLDVAPSCPPAAVTWTLYLDVENLSARRSRDAIDVIEDPTAVRWRLTMSGKASVAANGLRLEPVTVARAGALESLEHPASATEEDPALADRRSFQSPPASQRG